MKYIGFRMPSECWDGYDWLYNLIENKDTYKFYLTEAENINKARIKFFDKIYRELDKDIKIAYAFDGLKYICFHYDEDFLKNRYRKDFTYISSIHDKWATLKKMELKKVEINEEYIDIIKKFNYRTLKKMCYISLFDEIVINTVTEI